MRASALACLLAGCGGSGSAPDAGTPDAPEVGTVTVDGPTARSDMPITVTLIVNDARGRFVSRTGPEDSNARFSVEVPLGGMVSIISEDPAYDTQILTWTGVQSGDHLVHYDRRDPTATYPIEYAITPVAGATIYQFGTYCAGYDFRSGGRFDAGLVFYELSCFPDPAPSVSVLVNAKTPSGSRFANAVQVPLAASGTTTVPLSDYQDPAGSVSVTVAGAAGYPDSTMGFSARLAPGHYAYGGYVYGMEGATITLGPMDVPAFPGMLSIHLRQPDGNTTVTREYEIFPNALELDVANDFLPHFDGVLSVDGKTFTVIAPDGVDADILHIGLTLSDDALGDMHWSLLAAGRDHSLPVPDLQLVGYPAVNWIFAYDYPSVDGYDAARPMVRELLNGPIDGDRRISSAFF